MGILFLPARQERCSSLLSCSAVRPLPLLRLRPRLIPTMATATPESTVALASGAMADTVLDTAVATPALDMDLDMEATATLVLEVTTASVRLRPSLRLKLRLIPDMDTVLAIAVATPLLDMLDLDTAVDTTEDSAMAEADPYYGYGYSGLYGGYGLSSYGGYGLGYSRGYSTLGYSGLGYSRGYYGHGYGYGRGYGYFG